MEDNDIEDRGLLKVERFEDITKQNFLIERDRWAHDFIESINIDCKDGDLSGMLYDAFATGFMRGYDIALLHKNGNNDVLIP